MREGGEQSRGMVRVEAGSGGGVGPHHVREGDSSTGTGRSQEAQLHFSLRSRGPWWLSGTGPGCGLTWLWAVFPTPHTVVTTDSDPAG